MSPLVWFMLGLAAVAGPPMMGLLLDELDWWLQRRKERRQALLAKRLAPIVGAHPDAIFYDDPISKKNWNP